MEHFVTIASFTFPSEYAVLRLLLEQEQIRFFFQNETMVSMLPFQSNAIGGIRLKVHPEDCSEAMSIIENLSKGSHLRIV
ncbi:MAG TPA: DUF2007 domain-containing protein [Flavobacteriaceae bacterium]|nr:DUF2007 domain-containing protein [Flavobacteriaceae bacterium]MCB9211948.1 DUF2007 domain-containing protein [Alteromonas sp.]HPF09958.1 DUF2007 domain-containing protein [Flavobacteriaceae bacterium]HQU20055.1 DUF2007 domain-containing protein [Flavobacteriaceae bacterium]HQU63959.1 DUF2007 domain-containing protein [Flavobacteriaceae bacterium]